MSYIKVQVRRNWRSKPHPYWFRRRYPSGLRTLQVGPIEVWWRK